MERELDLAVELLRIEKFRSLMREWPDLRVPRTHPELSSEAVLVLEYVGGVRLGKLLDVPGLVVDSRGIARSPRWRASTPRRWRCGSTSFSKPTSAFRFSTWT